jgi:DNA repair protein RecN (Recombination protein N)
MLTNLQVRNFAIIDKVEVEFANGMTVLTGETGAGKSILVDALGLVLGERGGTGLVRQGSKRAEFTAEFDLADLPLVSEWLADKALDSDDECVLRRVITEEGRSRAFVNGNAVPLQTLKALGEKLLDIHGQHFHQSLGKSTVQRELLDHFGSAIELRKNAEAAYGDWRSLTDELQALRTAESERASKLDLLTFQTQELDALDLQPGELEQLQLDRDRLQNSGKLAEGVSAVVEAVYEADTGSAQSIIAEACQTLESLSKHDPSLSPIANLLREADIQVSEAAESLRRYGDSLQINPAERDRIEERLDAIHSLARKHRVDITQLDELRTQLHEQLAALKDAEARGEELDENVEKAWQAYSSVAASLSKKRKSAGKKLSTQVTAAMVDLGMAGGKFVVDVATLDRNEAKSHGVDNIEYLISANPGQDPQPLSKIASGGELSRMSLAIQVIASDGSAIPTMIFDEVDSGVGGGIAEMVGKRLRDVGQSRQVLCVTHLPQVAAQASHHFRIMKITDGKTTRTGVSELVENERIEELARMLGGVKITDRTREHAAEMLQNGERKSA